MRPELHAQLADARAAWCAQAVLAAAAVLGFLWLARALLVPAALGAVMALSVRPLVRRLVRRGMPTPAAAAVGTILATVVVVALAALLWNRVGAFVDELPGYEGRLREVATKLRRQAAHLQARSEQLVEPPRQAGQVKVQESVPWGSLLLGTAQSALELAGQATVAIFMIYFALADGPRFREKLLARARRPGARARTLAALDELHRDVEQYMLNRVVLNALLGLVTWGAFALYGLEHAEIWGFTTALLHFVPYVGPAVGLVLPSAMALLQYESPGRMAGAALIYGVLVSLQGNVVDPIFLGRQLRLSALVVFLGSLFWFLIWGPVGLFLAVPLISTTRILCKYTPRLRPLAELLGE